MKRLQPRPHHGIVVHQPAETIVPGQDFGWHAGCPGQTFDLRQRHVALPSLIEVVVALGGVKDHVLGVGIDADLVEADVSRFFGRATRFRPSVATSPLMFRGLGHALRLRRVRGCAGSVRAYPA